MKDQAGIRAIGAAVARLPVNPYPPEAFRWGDVLRLRVGPYRVMYTVEGDLITVLRGHDRSAPGHIYSDQEFKAAVLHGLHRG